LSITLAEFQRLQDAARAAGDRGATLGHVLRKYGGSTTALRLTREGELLRFVLGVTGHPRIVSVPLYKDGLSGMEYFFALLPLEYLHHDDRINPRSIGSNIRGLIEELMRKRPQLHIALGWWQDDGSGNGQVTLASIAREVRKREVVLLVWTVRRKRLDVVNVELTIVQNEIKCVVADEALSGLSAPQALLERLATGFVEGR
jgi:hypothetical protein